MNKAELVRAIAEETALTQKEVAAVLDAFVENTVASLVKGEEVAIAGFGKFVVKNRAARESINPRTKEVVKVPACKAPAFKVGKALKDAVNNR